MSLGTSLKLTGLSLLAATMFACSGAANSTDGGSSDTDAGPTVQPTLSSIQANIFTPTCATAGCHNVTMSFTDNLVLNEGMSYSNLVNAPSVYNGVSLKRVEPGNPMQSFLYLKVAPTTLSTGAYMNEYGYPMPYVGSPVTSEQVAAISTWITNGAQNN